MLSGIQGRCRERNMSLIGTGNYHQVHASVRGYVFRFAQNLRLRHTFPHDFRMARTDQGKFETGNGLDQRCMKSLAHETKADKGYAHGVSSFGHERLSEESEHSMR